MKVSVFFQLISDGRTAARKGGTNARIDGRSEEYTYRRVIDPKSRVTLVKTNFSLCSQFKTDVLCVSVSFSILSYISGRSSLHG